MVGMFRRSASAEPKVLCIEAFGVRFEVRIEEPALLPAVEAILPPTSQACECGESAAEFSLGPFLDGYEVIQNDIHFARGCELGLALQILDAQMRMVIATKAPDRAFIHAGSVAVGNRVIVLPGSSFAGKTTLVAELVRRGASYLSDEYAVLDSDGRVHPYPKPLSIRPPNATLYSSDSPTETPASALGAVTATGDLRVGLIVATSYRPGAKWSPQRRSPAHGAVLLMSNALAARHDPKRVLQAVRRAAADTVTLEGERGDVADIAPDLIGRLAS